MSANEALNWWRRLSSSGQQAMSNLYYKGKDPALLSTTQIIYIWKQEH